MSGAGSDCGPPSLLVVAKAPVAGQAKTRLAASIGAAAGADIAAAALLDTLDTVASLQWPGVIALTGDLKDAPRADELIAACRKHQVVAQRGQDFAARLAHAHADADAGRGVVQIGMDTPQVTGAELQMAAAALQSHDAALGHAHDGGWWLLAVRRSELAQCLGGVPTSRPETGSMTHAALHSAGARVASLPTMSDVDTWPDACAVAAQIPGSRFADAVWAARQKSRR